MKEKKGIRTHKTYFRRIMKDQRLHPRLRLAAQLFLAYIEDLYPKDLLESVIESEFGLKNKNKQPDEEFIQELVDKKASQGLKDQWKEMTGK